MRHFGFPILFAFLLLAGCANSSCRTPVGNPAITPSVVSAGGDRVGELTQWGGALVEARHRKDSTELEVVAYPLDDCGRPQTGFGPTGRFIVVHPGFLETTDYQVGRRVSATGRIVGIRQGRLGDVDYSFPLLESYKVRLWPDRQVDSYYSRPWVNIGIGGGSGNVFGGLGVVF